MEEYFEIDSSNDISNIKNKIDNERLSINARYMCAKTYNSKVEHILNKKEKKSQNSYSSSQTILGRNFKSVNQYYNLKEDAIL